MKSQGFLIHGFDNDYKPAKKIMHQQILYCPRVGDTLRLYQDEFYTVIELIWCFDEDECPFQRVNLRLTKAADAAGDE